MTILLTAALAALSLTGCTGNGVSPDAGYPLERFSLSVGDYVYHAAIDQESHIAKIGAIKYGGQVSKVDYRLADGATISPDPKDFTGDWPESQDFTVTCDGEETVYTVVLSAYESRFPGADDDVLFLKRVLYANDVAKMIDLNYLPMKLYPGIYERIGQEFSLFRILKEVYGVESYQQYKVLKVCVADDDKAKALSVKEGSALFDMYKVSYMASGAPIHVSISYISGESANYVISGEENRQFYSGFNWKT